MGLDIVVYRNYTVAERDEDDDVEDYDFHVYQATKDWNYKCEELEIDEYYIGERICHPVSYSYSSHMWFRMELLRLIGREDLIINGGIDWDAVAESKDMDFYELIYFSDCEGCLDSKTNRILLNNFLDHKDKVDSMDQNDRFVHCYNDWFETFTEGAKDNSVVIFR